MFAMMLPVRRRCLTSVLWAMIISGVSVPFAMGQSQPGRILVDNTGPSILEFNIDGSNGFAIAGNTDNNAVFRPSVAGNGTIAFTGNTGVDGSYLGYEHIFLTNADGTNVRQITSNPSNPPSNYNGELSPAISPDGTMVAFLAAINGAPDGSHQQEIYLVNADGSNLRQLTPFIDNSAGDYSQSAMVGLAWSPDSTKVAFRGSVYTSQCGTYFNNPIFVNVIGTINTDGTGMQTLACDNNDGYVSAIDWSPDGTLLAWTRNVSHGAQGCSGCVGEPAIAFYDLSGQNRYSAGITSSELTTDSCQGGPHCIHFSPDSSQLAYVNAYPNNGNPCQSSCNVSFINLDGSNQTNSTIPSGGNTVWWEPGAAIPAPAQLTVAGPNGPSSTVEVWPGFSQQITPTLSDSSSNLILHTAQNYVANHYFYASACLAIGPFGLAVYTSGGGGSGYGTISASNAGLTSNTINFNCWPSPPCTFSLNPTSTDLPASGALGTFGVTADPGGSGSTCPWTATSSASWITITSGSNGAGNGSVSFSVSANSGAARQGTITIAGLTYTVSQDAASATLQSITVTPNPASVAAGLTLQFTATATYSGGSTKNVTASVTWSSSNTTIAAISNAGLATGVAAGGPITISAGLSGITGTAQLTVTAPVLQSITVSPATASIAAGLTQQFTATGHYSDGSVQTLTSASWSSSNTSVASISNTGLAKGVAFGGPVMITAALGSISGSAQLTVTAPALVSIAVTPANPSVPVGSTQQFMATGSYSDGSMQNVTGSVTWTSTNTAVATINTSGLASALSAGASMISAAQGNLSGSTTLNVVTLQSITISPMNPSTVVGSTLQFTATGHYSDGSTRVLTSATWTSSNTHVATISSPGGLANAMAKGSATITAASGAISGSSILTVNAVVLQSITVSPAAATIALRGTQQFMAIGNYDNGTTRDLTSTVTWSSSSKKVASVNSTGLATGLAAGTVTVSAKTSMVVGSAMLTVQ